jgi:hypothetical protein
MPPQQCQGAAAWAGWTIDRPIKRRQGRGDATLQQGGRWRLDDPAVVAQFPLFAELRAAGATEYALRIVAFSERRTALEGIVLSMATDRPGGFTDDKLALVEAVVPALSLAAYRMGLLQVATGTLGAYLGPATGRRVLQGMIRRGETESMRAALLLADLRNFTGVSESADREPSTISRDSVDDARRSNGDDIGDSSQHFRRLRPRPHPPGRRLLPRQRRQSEAVQSLTTTPVQRLGVFFAHLTQP